MDLVETPIYDMEEDSVGEEMYRSGRIPSDSYATAYSHDYSDPDLDAFDRSLLEDSSFLRRPDPAARTKESTSRQFPFTHRSARQTSGYRPHTPPPVWDGSSSSPLSVTPNAAASQRHQIPRHHGIQTGPRHPMAHNASSHIEHRGLPSIQGIQLVSTRELPDRFRSIFPFPNFNAVQSECFDAVYNQNDNIVISSPTGSGKTAILELAICNLISNASVDQCKIVYQAPTKALCNERFRDWQTKLSPLNLVCAELTGDTEQSQLPLVQRANVIITTPEKWDSITRKWKDHRKLMEMVKLFLIDEVHILGEVRGATLEAILSRMKTIGVRIRFVALSATIPNSDDIATWLGKNKSEPHVPAYRRTFGEEFRPVKLHKHVYGYAGNCNDFAFDQQCSARLPDIIVKHSSGKPLMIFCITRKATVDTAKLLAGFWNERDKSQKPWPQPNRAVSLVDKDLQALAPSGVAFHHAGLEVADRYAIEQAYLQGAINVICCTSTLAVGINLPCHMVIIKNTVSWQGLAIKEYSDLEIMQMLGRAGRPQFDKTAIAIIMTKSEKQKRYEKMVSGEQLLESCLHLNLIDHLNAEIGLGSITDLRSAQSWLRSTFFFVRLLKNPDYYKLSENLPQQDPEETLRVVCERDVQLLGEANLVYTGDSLKSTEFGHAMAKYYVKFETMKLLLSLSEKAKLSEILSVLAQANEFSDLRLKANEKSLFRAINKADGVKFPMRVDIALTAHKVSLILQHELGSVDYPSEEVYRKHRLQFNQDRLTVFSHVQRLVRCIIDCKIILNDSVSVRNGLELARSFSAKAWDSSPLQMIQIPTIGIVAVRKLINAGVTNLVSLEDIEPHRIEMIMSKNPPFGSVILSHLKRFPKLRVSLAAVGKPIESEQSVKLRVKAEIGFMNEEVPLKWLGRTVSICFIAEVSDGTLIEFRRVVASRIGNGQDILFTAALHNADQFITCYLMCEEIAGTLCFANLIPQLPPTMFPKKAAAEPPKVAVSTTQETGGLVSAKKMFEANDDDYGEADWADDDLLQAQANGEFIPIDDLDLDSVEVNQPRRTVKQSALPIEKPAVTAKEATRLANGKWECGHFCKDKTACKHYCCREGVDKPPKKHISSTTNQQRAANTQLPTKSPWAHEEFDPSTSQNSRAPVKNQTKPRTFFSQQSPRLSLTKTSPLRNSSLSKLQLQRTPSKYTKFRSTQSGSVIEQFGNNGDVKDKLPSSRAYAKDTKDTKKPPINLKADFGNEGDSFDFTDEDMDFTIHPESPKSPTVGVKPAAKAPSSRGIQTATELAFRKGSVGEKSTPSDVSTLPLPGSTSDDIFDGPQTSPLFFRTSSPPRHSSLSGPSPSSVGEKRSLPAVNERRETPTVDIETATKGSKKPRLESALVGADVAEVQGLEDMEGIDRDIFRQFADIVDFQ